MLKKRHIRGLQYYRLAGWKNLKRSFFKSKKYWILSFQSQQARTQTAQLSSALGQCCTREDDKQCTCVVSVPRGQHSEDLSSKSLKTSLKLQMVEQSFSSSKLSQQQLNQWCLQVFVPTNRLCTQNLIFCWKHCVPVKDIFNCYFFKGQSAVRNLFS